MVDALNAARDLAAKPMPTPQIPVVQKPVLSAGALAAGSISNEEYLREKYGSAGKQVIINTQVTNNNTTSDADIGDTIVKIAKYGLVVTG
jgi:hypothetical protein